MKKYTDYNAEQLAATESFQNWFFKRNERDILFWDRWIAAHQALKENELAEAIAILSHLQFRDEPIPPEQVKKSWSRVEERLAEQKQSSVSIELQGEPIRNQSPFKIKIWKVAASISFLLLCAYFTLKFEGTKQLEHSTTYGETRSITLPDNSTVMLNSNSTLAFNENWEKGDREVWLSGEAYFSVVHTENHQEFLVHTNSGLNVKVLGTEFNVTNRKRLTRVVLNSGKIELDIKSKLIRQQMVMSPGDMVEFKDTSKVVIQRIVNPELYSSWKCRQLMFDHTKLEEVIFLLEENYGLKVEVSDKSLLQKEVSGSVPNSNINLLMDALAESLNLNIKWTRNHVKITPRHSGGGTPLNQ